MFKDDPGKPENGFAAGPLGGGVPTGSPMSTEGKLDQPGPHPRLEPDAREQIGARLQAVFAEIEGQPIPDEQIDLLLALRRAERELARREA